MSPRNAIVLLLALSTVLFLAACGGNGSSPATPVAPPSGAFSNSNLNGTYVFSISGTDQSNGAPYAMVGTFTANGSGGNGKGGITAGTFDLNDAVSGTAAGASITSGSTYSVGQDGRGEAMIATNISGLSNITFDFVLSSSSHGLITEFDSFGSGSGTLDLQVSGVTPSGTYAFSLSGAASNSGSTWATVGNFAVSGGTFSGSDDFNENTLAFSGSTVTGSLVLGPSATPATTLAVVSSSGSSVFTGTFDAVAIDATHLKFIEMDATATLSGDAYSQTSPTIATGTLAFTLAGSEFAAGGLMTTNGSGGITGTEDFNVEGTNVSSQSSPAPFGAAYAVDPTNAGRYVLSSFTTFEGGSSYAAYPSSGGVLLLEIDGTGISVGAAYPQTAGATFAASQGYGMNLSGANLAGVGNGAVEVDDIAEFAAAASGGTLSSGIIDENYAPGGVAALGIALSNGTYGTIGSGGRYGISATAGNSTTSTLLGGFTLTFYAVDGTTFPFMEVDPGQVSTGVIVLQTPSSSSSAIAHAHMFVVRPLIRALGARQKKN
ncbi:MAG: hypothetical protein WB762_08310 [Candidatus Sulfotelmatobacter sp.]